MHQRFTHYTRPRHFRVMEAPCDVGYKSRSAARDPRRWFSSVVTSIEILFHGPRARSTNHGRCPALFFYIYWKKFSKTNLLIQFKVDNYNSVDRLHFPFVLWTCSNNIKSIAVTELTAINSDTVGIFILLNVFILAWGIKKLYFWFRSTKLFISYNHRVFSQYSFCLVLAFTGNLQSPIDLWVMENLCNTLINVA